MMEVNSTSKIIILPMAANMLFIGAMPMENSRFDGIMPSIGERFRLFPIINMWVMREMWLLPLRSLLLTCWNTSGKICHQAKIIANESDF